MLFAKLYYHGSVFCTNTVLFFTETQKNTHKRMLYTEGKHVKEEVAHPHVGNMVQSAIVTQ